MREEIIICFLEIQICADENEPEINKKSLENNVIAYNSYDN